MKLYSQHLQHKGKKVPSTSFYQVSPQYQQIKNDQSNGNEKQLSEPSILGVNGSRYLNDIHNFYPTEGKRNKQVYDILALDDQSKQLLYCGSGFKSFMYTIVSLSDKQSDSQYQSTDSSVIITQTYEKFQKEMEDNNYHINKSLTSYNKLYNKFLFRKSTKLSKLTTVSSLQKIPVIKILSGRINKIQYSLSETQMKKQIDERKISAQPPQQTQEQLQIIQPVDKLLQIQKYNDLEKQDITKNEPQKETFTTTSFLPEISTILELIKNERITKMSGDSLFQSQNLDYKYQFQYHNSPQKFSNLTADKIINDKRAFIKQLTIVNRPQLIVNSSSINLPVHKQNQLINRSEKIPFNPPKALSPCVKELIEQYTLNGRSVNRISIVTLPLNNPELQQSSQRTRILRNSQQSYEFEKPKTRDPIMQEFRIKSKGPSSRININNLGNWTYSSNAKLNEFNIANSKIF